ncbi:MAG: SDR family oxidoreductase [Spirochaetia bacterium]
MNILIAGGFGHLGQEVVKTAVKAGHNVTALDRSVRELGFSGFKPIQADVTNPAELAGTCESQDIIISTVGLTVSSRTVTHYDVDLAGNLNLLEEAQRAGVPKFVYVSVIHADSDPSVPMLDAKNRFEQALLKSGIDYLIFRPTGYFYDIAKVFQPMVKKGKVTLLKGNSVRANVIATSDFAQFILHHIEEKNKTFEVGGKEVYTYQEIADIFFQAAGKQKNISYAPAFLFDILSIIAKAANSGKYANIKFGKWTLLNDMEAEIQTGEKSFQEYVTSLYSHKEEPC